MVNLQCVLLYVEKKTLYYISIETRGMRNDIAQY